MNEWTSGFDSQVFNLQLKTFMWSHNIQSSECTEGQTKHYRSERQKEEEQWAGNGDDAMILSVVQNTNKHVILYTAALQTVSQSFAFCFYLNR